MRESSRLEKTALNIRKNILKATSIAGSGHIAGPMGIADIFAYLYTYYFNTLINSSYGLKDIPLILSCGHYAPVLYSTLHEVELIRYDELVLLRKFGSPLQGHNKRNLKLGIHNSAGSLGQGLGLATGLAIARQQKENAKVICIISDGETNEGSIWESALFASKYRLSNLITILDRNGIQQSGNSNDQMPLEPLYDKWQSFGWDVIRINGNDFDSIHLGFEKLDPTNHRPKLLLTHTTPGKGVSFLENNYKWHGKVLSREELANATNELEKKYGNY